MGLLDSLDRFVDPKLSSTRVVNIKHGVGNVTQDTPIVAALRDGSMSQIAALNELRSANPLVSSVVVHPSGVIEIHHNS